MVDFPGWIATLDPISPDRNPGLVSCDTEIRLLTLHSTLKLVNCNLPNHEKTRLKTTQKRDANGMDNERNSEDVWNAMIRRLSASRPKSLNIFACRRKRDC
jgi:hypothetical protein